MTFTVEKSTSENQRLQFGVLICIDTFLTILQLKKSIFDMSEPPIFLENVAGQNCLVNFNDISEFLVVVLIRSNKRIKLQYNMNSGTYIFSSVLLSLSKVCYSFFKQCSSVH